MDFTVHFATINLLVVFGATVAAIVLGGLWYSPIFLGKPWRAANKLPQAAGEMSNPAATFGVSFFLQLITASMLAALLGPNSSGGEGAQLGAIIAVSFVATALGILNLFERRPMSLILINAGYNIVSFSMMGFIVGQWS